MKQRVSLRDKISAFVVRFLYTLSKQTERQVPFILIYPLRRLVGIEILNLSVFKNSIKNDGKYIEDKYLSRLFAGEKFSTWALDIDTLNFLIRLIKKEKPKAILEFGAGISTICCAYVLKEIYPGLDQPFVFSIEQDRKYLEEVRQRLTELGLDHLVNLYLSPVEQQMI